jgi:hypothetical protein
VAALPKKQLCKERPRILIFPATLCEHFVVVATVTEVAQHVRHHTIAAPAESDERGP